MIRPTLAIAIPTYCRPDGIALNFAHFMQEAAELGVEIYVSDDSPGDETEQLAMAAHRTYGNVIYRRNCPSLGHDQNVMQTILWPDTDYVWIMGDVFHTAPGGLRAVLDSLVGQDFQFINRNGRHFEMVEPCTGDEAIELICDRIWHQTLTGSTIYHRRVREWINQSEISIHPNFPHIDVILGYATAQKTSVGWFGPLTLESAPKGNSYWHLKALDVFVDDWVSVITAYPAIISNNIVKSILKSHSNNTRLFNIEFMLNLRSIGHLDWKAIKRPHFWDVMHLPRAVIIGLLMVPVFSIAGIISVKRAAERSKRQSPYPRQSPRLARFRTRPGR